MEPSTMEPATTTTIHGGQPNHPDSTGLCLLSLDGGGVRGLSTLYILKGLMDRLNEKRPNCPPIKPCEVFDLIGGTSTGGLIAIMLGRLEMNVDECITAYIKLMGQIFKKKARRFPVSWTGIIKPQFDKEELESAINEVITSRGAKPTDLFNDGTDRGCKVFVCAIAKETKFIEHLRSYNVHGNRNIPATICQAARATSAAAGIFDSVTIGARIFADGAIVANNPVNEVEREASDIWCSDTADLKPRVKCFISIGTGNPGIKPIEENIFRFLSETLVELATQTEITAKNFIANWRQHYDNNRYFRFNVEQGLQNVGLAEHEEQGTIIAVTDEYLDQQPVKFSMRNCVENLKLKQNKTEITFAADIYPIKIASHESNGLNGRIHKRDRSEENWSDICSDSSKEGRGKRARLTPTFNHNESSQSSKNTNPSTESHYDGNSVFDDFNSSPTPTEAAPSQGEYHISFPDEDEIEEIGPVSRDTPASERTCSAEESDSSESDSSESDSSESDGASDFL